MSVSIKAGISTLRVKAGSTFVTDGSTEGKDLGLGSEYRLQVNFNWNSLNAAIAFYNQARIGSNYGTLPSTRMGTALYYYPFGLPLHTTLLDNGVAMTQNRLAPFICGGPSLTTVAITYRSDTGSSSFNGLALGWQGGGGVEFPMGQRWAVVLEAVGEGTLISDSTGNAALSLSGFTGFLGVSIRP